MTTLDDDIPVGDLRLYDSYAPALAAGSWFVTVTHELHDGTRALPDTFRAVQELLVSAPQFAVDTTAVVAPYPPDTSTGRYGDVLPHVVLADPMLPWERTLPGSPAAPWLALLVLTDDEILDGEDTATRTVRTTVADFLTPADGVLVPALTRAADVEGTDPCTSVRLRAEVFAAVAPRLDELRFLAHCRQADTGDKATEGLDARGLFAVVVANRFPATPARGADGATKNVAHLVSLEGLDRYLVAGADLGAYTSVRLLSLASWSFAAQADNAADFRGLAEGVARGADALRLPAAYAGSDAPAEVEVRERLANGFVPLDYRTRSGETTFAWYRGPLSPVPTSPVARSGPFPSADAAVVYDDARGVFDLSLAAAWQAGRACALADATFGQRVLDLRARAQRFADTLLNRLESRHFTASQVAEAVGQGSVQSVLANVLTAQLLADVGAGPAPEAPPLPSPEPAPPPGTDPKQAVADFLATAEAREAIVTAVQADLDPVARWLASLLLLVPVPFGHLVADPRLLPVESLRFFHVDANWTSAALDGATSVGIDSSRQSLLGELTYGAVHDAAGRAALVHRDRLRGVDPATDPSGTGVVSGLLLRSALVSGWPNLAVRPYDAAGALLPTLRMDRLAPTVLLCLFDGVPSTVELSEPQESLRFGSDEGGALTLRNVSAGNGPIGAQLRDAAPFPLRDPAGATAVHLRSAASRVLDLDPGSPSGLVRALAGAVGADPATFGPADLALQMVNAPEAIRFSVPKGPTP
ncbi:MAG TPA: hypothetical protein VGX28_12960 [Frankiaceae bacterium]|jgi:hypothetical protein|nr:hypothetical protein [Frankiaceae bacterium]